MISVHRIAVENEMPAVLALGAAIERAWPGVGDNPRDHIDLLAGLRIPSDVDLLVLVDLAQPRELPPQRRRDGTHSQRIAIQHALIAVEIKQLDATAFTRIGNQLVPAYGGMLGARTVSQQAADGGLAVRTFARRMGVQPFVHALGWLTSFDPADLTDIDSTVVGGSADWFVMLDAGMQQNGVLARLGHAATADAIRILRERLLERRTPSRRDRRRVEDLSRAAATATAVDALVAHAGSAQLQLYGRGGSGKTTTLAMTALQLAQRGERVLILTFHRTLRVDIAHLCAQLCNEAGVRPEHILVETTTNFLISAVTALGETLPRTPSAAIDYDRLDALFGEVAALLAGDPDDPAGVAAALHREHPERLGWDHVFVDEAQDCSDAERDLLRALYGHRRIVIADGVEQLVRRPQACDWLAGIPRHERRIVSLPTSLRMLGNVARFASAVATELGVTTWRLEPNVDLPGGRIILVSGDAARADVLSAVMDAAAAGGADPVDCLICAPPTRKDDDPSRRLIVAAAHAGIALWDGTIPANRGTAPADPGVLRMVKYESCRGLEGWITVALELDTFAANRRQYPNMECSGVPLDLIVARWLLIPLTRAVHTLVVSVRDPDSALARVLTAAAARMPFGVVARVDAAALPTALAPPSRAARGA